MLKNLLKHNQANIFEISGIAFKLIPNLGVKYISKFKYANNAKY